MADFTGDGNKDVLVIAADGTGQVMVNDGSGAFSQGATFDFSAGTAASTVAVADFNNDGYLDVLSGGSVSTTMTLRTGDGAGGFNTSYTHTAAVAALLDLQAADFNNDGNMDYIARTAANWYMYTGNGSGSFSIATSGAQTSTAGLAVGDVDNDGAVDFMLNRNDQDAVYFYEANTASRSALSDFNLANTADATLLTSILDDTLEALTEERTNIANAMTRLETAQSFNGGQQESLTDALSAVVDADLGLETSELTKNQIMQQAQIAALAQANANAQAILGLLQQY